MIITANEAGFSLNEPEDFSRFHVDAQGLTAAQLSDLATDNIEIAPIADADHLWISVDFLRNGDTSPERTEHIDRLVGFATERGWYDGEADAIRAHVENLAS
ncbi:hypothetical protein [Gulosibacter molinativorax]|uniref:Uncharacterized protein n=1 Tax=Gulosibacter molinativorax TaxID=256821 RepID=A0ABT7CAL8_9MICO|nr:hypothetical protein [Gulosibacter molinativorax]MDJ1372248.1 hypothetical protein [Gulosibacter molinativorax]